jgi:hypothetical protein
MLTMALQVFPQMGEKLLATAEVVGKNVWHK